MKRPNKGFCGMTFYALVLICILVFFCASRCKRGGGQRRIANIDVSRRNGKLCPG